MRKRFENSDECLEIITPALLSREKKISIKLPGIQMNQLDGVSESSVCGLFLFITRSLLQLLGSFSRFALVRELSCFHHELFAKCRVPSKMFGWQKNVKQIQTWEEKRLIFTVNSCSSCKCVQLVQLYESQHLDVIIVKTRRSEQILSFLHK